MLKTAICLVFAVAFASNAMAQNTDEITVRAGEYPGKVIPLNRQLRYDQFRPGKAFFESGKASAALPFNYNFLTGEWQFIEKGDTVAVMGATIFPLVEVGEDQFYRDEKEGYLEVLAGNELVKLMLQQKWGVVRKDAKVNNGYGEFTDGTTGTRSTKYSSSLAKTVRNEDVVWGLKRTYWLMDEKNHLYRCTQGNFSKQFPGKKELIKSFIKENDVELDNEVDLKKLLAFCLE